MELVPGDPWIPGGPPVWLPQGWTLEDFIDRHGEWYWVMNVEGGWAEGWVALIRERTRYFRSAKSVHFGAWRLPCEPSNASTLLAAWRALLDRENNRGTQVLLFRGVEHHDGIRLVKILGARRLTRTYWVLRPGMVSGMGDRRVPALSGVEE
jgi:hypothetical protein